jgi:hypothetical protein
MSQNNSEIVERIRGRPFTIEEIAIIKNIVGQYYTEGRTKASQEICKALNWKQPNGWLKERACRDVLLLLEKRGYLELPPRKSYPNNVTSKIIKPDVGLKYNKLITDVCFESVYFEQAKSDEKEIKWNNIVAEYHYLGFTRFVGRSMKYLIYANEQIIGAIGWCDPAWKLSARDNILNSINITTDEIRTRGINNGRYLILPWIKVNNLASFVLAKAVRILESDWSDYYAVNPLYLETFVDPARFAGVCYKAANWIQIGTSKGYRKCGARHTNSQEAKILFLYPLHKKVRKAIAKYTQELGDA